MDISRLIVQSLVAWWGRGAWSPGVKKRQRGGGWCAGRKEVDFICKTKKEKILFLSTYSAVGTSLTHDSDRAQNQQKSNALSSLFNQSCNNTDKSWESTWKARRHEHSKCSLHIIFSIQIIRCNRFDSIQSWAWLDRTRVINEWIITKNFDNGRSVK